ncbi:MAG: hypothetical protein ACI8ZN_002785, partial [Bacteroidia bacterium]
LCETVGASPLISIGFHLNRRKVFVSQLHHYQLIGQ